MKKKRRTQREIGFIQGVAYATYLLCVFDEPTYAKGIIKESGINIEDIRKYASKEDLEVLEEKVFISFE
jgi:hypothetical protein